VRCCTRISATRSESPSAAKFSFLQSLLWRLSYDDNLDGALQVVHGLYSVWTMQEGTIAFLWVLLFVVAIGAEAQESEGREELIQQVRPVLFGLANAVSSTYPFLTMFLCKSYRKHASALATPTRRP